MKGCGLGLAVAAAAMSLAAALFGGLAPAAAAPPPAQAMPVGAAANPPVGHIAFCRALPAECAASGSHAPMQLDAARWAELAQVNAAVNAAVAPVTDRDHYGADEVWALPAGRGDCEDYVLLKRKLLLQRGWSSGALLVTVVFDEIGDGHAVLLVRTDRGELVLDNKVEAILPWERTPYRYVKRQSVADPMRWVWVGDPRWSAATTAAAKR